MAGIRPNGAPRSRTPLPVLCRFRVLSSLTVSCLRLGGQAHSGVYGSADPTRIVRGLAADLDHPPFKLACGRLPDTGRPIRRSQRGFL
jgi:hypothetical protein